MIGLPYGEKNCDDMLIRFHMVPERNGRTDGQTDKHTNLLYQCRASVCWRAIKKRIIPAIITGRISSFFLLLYHTPNSLCWLDGGPPNKNVASKVWASSRKLGVRTPLPPTPSGCALAARYIIYDFLLVGHCKHSSMLYHFRVSRRWIIVTLKSGL